MTGSIKRFFSVLNTAFKLLRKRYPLMLASSTAFFALFALSPMIVILASLLNLIFQKEEIHKAGFEKIKEVFGEEATEQITFIVENIRGMETEWWITAAGFLLLIFLATNLLRVIKQSIHYLWHIRKKPGKRLKYNLRERLTAFIIILSVGLLFLITILLDTVVVFVQRFLVDYIPLDNFLIQALNIAFSLLVITATFLILFKVLPDVRLHWKVALPGSILTALLFTIGKFIFSQVLIYSNIATIFGASASFVLILLFIFYFSFIIYFGASFTYVYGETIKTPVMPGRGTERYVEERVD